ncbi:MAG: TonB-dependent receptor plug domain-containing protein [Bacteroidales bacterium]|nr:TonB-dependent receptor plug domain-containing protein [Bacteroidales bacterium]
MFLIFSTVLNLNAQEYPDTVFDAVQLAQVEVRGQKRHPLSPLVQKLSALSSQDIQQAGVQNFQDLLRILPGVDIRSRGSENVQADLQMRGGNFDQCAVLLDGIDLSDPQTGHYALDLPLPMAALNRVEAWQGAGAWPYGIAPFSGAVNFIPTPLGGTYLELTASGGMYGYYQIEGHAQYSRKAWSVAADAGHSASNGYTDNTDFKITQALVRLGYNRPEKAGTFKLSFGFADKRYGAQNFYSARYRQQYDKTKTFLAILQYSKVWRNWRLEGCAYWRQHHDRYDLFRYPSSAPEWYAGPNFHRTDVVGIGFTAAYAWLRGGTTTFGINYRYEHIFSNNLGLPMPEVTQQGSLGKPVPFEKNAFYTKSGLRQVANGFVQHNYRSANGKWKITAGLLLNGSPDFGVSLFGGASASYCWHPYWEWSVFVNHAYRLPTFTDLYYTSTTQQGNPNLKPEQAVTAETGLHWHLGAFLRAGAQVFYRYGFRIIDWVRQSGEEKWYSRNLTRLQTTGTEITFSYTPNIPYLRSIGLDYVFLFVGKKSGDNHSLSVTDYLRNHLSLTVEHGIYSSLGASWEFILNDRAGTYLNENSEETRYKPYVLCNLRLYWNRPRYEVFVTASNLFNLKYCDLGNIPQAGIWVKGGVKLRL